MRIGEAAAASGCHIETIRYYERIGLLPPPARTAGGYREYLPAEVERLRFITRGRELGFTLRTSSSGFVSCGVSRGSLSAQSLAAQAASVGNARFSGR